MRRVRCGCDVIASAARTDGATGPLIQRGIYQIPIPTKQVTIRIAHTAEDIDRTLDAYADAVAELRHTHPQAFN